MYLKSTLIGRQLLVAASCGACCRILSRRFSLCTFKVLKGKMRDSQRQMRDSESMSSTRLPFEGLEHVDQLGKQSEPSNRTAQSRVVIKSPGNQIQLAKAIRKINQANTKNTSDPTRSFRAFNKKFLYKLCTLNYLILSGCDDLANKFANSFFHWKAFTVESFTVDSISNSESFRFSKSIRFNGRLIR